MLIQCTKKLLDELKVKPETEVDEDALFSWHANLVYINHRKTIVLVNDSNRYSIVLYGLKAKDFKNLDEIIISAIRETFIEECIKEDIVEKYINTSPNIVYSKTKNRSFVAKLKYGCDNTHYFARFLNTNSINQPYLNIKANAYLIRNEDGISVHMYDMLFKDMEDFAQKPLFSCRAAEMKISLAMDKFKIWRRVIVPLNITFKQLHKIIQTLFSWQGYHLHEFIVYEGNHPKIKMVCGEGAFDFPDDIQRVLDYDVKLLEYIPKYDKIEYNYDFGDFWQHYIEVGKVIEDYGWYYPVCLMGEGNAPPEDVGGEYGYEQFFNAINDPDNPEHEDMKVWGKMQKYRDFDIKEVNRILKTILKSPW